jgi:ubiquinone/menaquinone biosynthesis C-methylase UbiE
MDTAIFDRAASQYDAYYDTELGQQVDALEKESVGRLLGGIRAGQVLEIGCGTGHWTQFLSGLGYSVLGIDPSEAMLEKARSRRLPDCEFICARAEKLPLPDHCMDLVVAIAVFEFIENREAAFSEVHRVLRPEGHFLLGVINERSQLGKSSGEDPILRHGRLFTSDLLAEVLCNFGEPRLEGCVLMDGQGRILDGTDAADTGKLLGEGAFLAGIVKKIH